MNKQRIRQLSDRRKSAMTMMELVIVLGIIAVVMLLTLPALKAWDARKVPDAVNLLTGMMETLQNESATRLKGKQIGVFFFVDPATGRQLAWPIEEAATATQRNRFRLRDSEPFKLPKPIRAVPLPVLRDGLEPRLSWSDAQLANEDHQNSSLPDPTYDPADADGWQMDGTQFHRNFFVMLYEDGRVDTSGDCQVFIADFNPTYPDPGDYPPAQLIDPNNGDRYPGFRTGLIVNPVQDPPVAWDNVIVEENGNEIRFLCTNEIVIYDDEEFQNKPSDRRRVFIQQLGVGLTAHPVTGGVIKLKPGEIES